MTTSFYAALCALIFIFLSFSVIRTRRKKSVALFDGGHMELKQKIRAHGNFSEFTPLFLILLFLAEFNGLASFVIHLIGLFFLTGRVLHAYSLIKAETYSDEGQLNAFPRYRFIGMIITFINLILLSALLLMQFFFPYL